MSRLRAAAPYRISTQELLAGAATPSRGEDIDMENLPPSRPVSPAFGFGASSATIMSRASTPAYMPAPPGVPLSRAATPAFDAQKLFLPDSRGTTPWTYDGCTPTPFSQRAYDGRTPMSFPQRTGTQEAHQYNHRAGPSSPPPAKRRRLLPDSSSSATRPLQELAQFFDTAAEDSDEDAGADLEEDEEETLSDTGKLFRCSFFFD